MAAHFPPTPLNLLTQLKAGGEEGIWQVSWKRFLELYHEPIEVIVRSCYRQHTGGHEPSSGFIEDAAANTVVVFFERGQYGYDKSKGRLRTYLRVLTNARVVDLLRKERPIDQRPLDAATQAGRPAESNDCPAAARLTLRIPRRILPMKAITLLTRTGGADLTPEEEAQLTRELSDAYHMDEASATSRDVQRIAEKVRARLGTPKADPPSEL